MDPLFPTAIYVVLFLQHGVAGLLGPHGVVRVPQPNLGHTLGHVLHLVALLFVLDLRQKQPLSQFPRTAVPAHTVDRRTTLVSHVLPVLLAIPLSLLAPLCRILFVQISHHLLSL